jgi:hypothetical protein
MANGGVSAKGIEKDDTAKSDRIRSCIHTIRGLQVMLDGDLADLYKIEVKALNQAVRCNAERFSAAYMFQLTANEHTSLRSQIVTLKKRGRHPKDSLRIAIERSSASAIVIKNETFAILIELIQNTWLR